MVDDLAIRSAAVKAYRARLQEDRVVNEVASPNRELLAAALTALDGRSFALAGSGVIREHGIVEVMRR